MAELSTEERRSMRPRRGDGAPPAPASRELPHNLDVERAVLAVLLDGRHAVAVHKVRQVVQHPLVFFQRDHRIVFLACLELDDQGQRIDAQSVAELLSRYHFRTLLDRLRQQELLLDSDTLDGLDRARLRSLYRRAPDEADAGYEDSALAALGGFTAVTDLAASYAPAAGIERNVALLFDYYLKRRLINRIGALADKAYRTPETFTQLIDTGSQAMLDLARHSQTSSLYAVSKVVDETIDDIGHREANPQDGVKTGVHGLDKRLVALRPGGLYVLAARPGAGKTSLALSFVRHISGHATNPSAVLFFSLEVDRIDLVKKLLATFGGIDFRALETGTLDPAQHEALNQAANALKGWALEMMDVSDLNVHALRSVVKRRMLESGTPLRLVVIDYLQLLSGSRSDMNEYEKVSEISRVLKVLARELRIPVLALSQMSRESEKGVGHAPREPRLSDLRGSGSIEQDADSVIFIHRLDQQDDGGDRRRMKIVIAKNRFGPTGFALMDFFPAKMRFVETAGEAAPDDGEEISRQDRLESRPTDDENVF